MSSSTPCKSGPDSSRKYPARDVCLSQRQQKSHPSAAKLPNLRHISKFGICSRPRAPRLTCK